jgi:hypothetical protein
MTTEFDELPSAALPFCFECFMNWGRREHDMATSQTAASIAVASNEFGEQCEDCDTIPKSVWLLTVLIETTRT